MLAQKLLSSLSGAAETLYVDDVFSTYTYTGNGTSKTITNGIDLAGKGGMVWVKQRDDVRPHVVTDTVRGVGQTLITNTTAQNSSYSAGAGLSAFNSNGFAVGPNSEWNFTGCSYVSHTFRRAPKFFDVVTYTGNGSINRAIAHSLGITPGMIIVKKTNSTSDWSVYHRSLSAPVNEKLLLNSTTITGTYSGMWGQANTSTTFGVSEYGAANDNGSTYVAYLFAHDTGTDGIIQCGTFTTDGSGTATVNLGWEPQYLMFKRNIAGTNWITLDVSRGWVNFASGTVALSPNASDVESSNALGYPTATGFYARNGFGTSETVYFLAIRRPNKPPTVGAQVYNAIARTGTGAAAVVTGVGFAPDLVMGRGRPGGLATAFCDRLRGANLRHRTYEAATEYNAADEVTSFDMSGVSVGVSSGRDFNGNTYAYINHFFKRAPGVFDQVCWDGTGAPAACPHNLGAVPEFILVKPRATAFNWFGYHAGITSAETKNIVLNTTAAATVYSGAWGNIAPTATTFNRGGDLRGNLWTYVAYLFATKAGISKCGSYTGNGSSLTLNMGFTTGARFFMVKRTDSTGDWYVWDTTRGIIAGNDGHLSLNTTAAEVTTNDSVDPDVTGLIVNQLDATNINVTSATYIYLAFA